MATARDKLASNFFWHQLDRFASSTLFVDFDSERRWRGAEIKATSGRIARNLIELGLAKHSNCVLFYKHNDHIQLTALGILFAGASVCVGYDGDPEHEHAHMLSLLKPAFVFVRHELVAELARHCKQIAGFQPRGLVIMDDDALTEEKLQSLMSGQLAKELQELSGNTRILGLHSHLLAAPAGSPPTLPVQVDPDWPAFILLTSGSTGRPKPAGRSQRNSLYVAHSLQGEAARELWSLGPASVLSGHLALDHGTGIFQLKQTLAHGLTCVLMDGYEPDRLLAAIERHGLTDIVLGSALLHKFLTSAQVSARLAHSPGASFGRLRNLLAVGSAIASPAVARDFMVRVPACSVRQAFGMTECGFLCVVPRAQASALLEDTRVVGYALPNVELKLLDLAEPAAAARLDESQRRPISEPDSTGELYVRGPTVSPGYHGAQYREQSRELFRPDGFYKSGDICSLTPEGMLRLHGRHSEVLCLYDGWKVLPIEIEQVLHEHPLVAEVAVVGVPHPDLRTCHAPRAYIVPREGVAIEDTKSGEGIARGTSNGKPSPTGTLSKREIFDFVAGRLSEPKHLIGGIKFMRELPKISIGKVDKKLLKKMDGLA